ncbi:unnamed protein product [Malus baccata var. baccata]
MQTDLSRIALRPFRLPDADDVLSFGGDDRHKADMGYALAARCWGQGITTKAVKIALSQVFKDYPDLVRLQSFVAVENKASQRILEKVGFQREGTKVGLSDPTVPSGRDVAERIKTDLSRIALRPFRLSDADDVLSFGGDDQVTRVLRGFKTLTTKDEALNFIENVCFPHPWRRSICIDDRSIGTKVGLSDPTVPSGRGIAERIIKIALRPFRLSDADDVLSFGGDDQVTRVLRGFKTLTTKDEALNFIKNVCIPHPWRRSICIDDRSIGFVTMFPGSGDDRHKADMGYALAARYWGQGITTKAVRIALSQVFKDYPDLVRLQSFVAVENKASQRVLEKVGFQREGVLRKYLYLKGDIKDMVVYSFLSSDLTNDLSSNELITHPSSKDESRP